MSKQFARPHFGKGLLATTVQAINCMGMISFRETHINYKIESRLIPKHLLMFPPRGRQGDTHGEKDTIENLVGFPTHKQIFGVQNSFGAIIFVIKPNLKLPEKV